MDVTSWNVAEFGKREMTGNGKFEKFLEEINEKYGQEFEGEVSCGRRLVLYLECKTRISITPMLYYLSYFLARAAHCPCGKDHKLLVCDGHQKVHFSCCPTKAG